MNKKILGISVVLMAVVILTTSLVGMVYAKKPESVSGHQVVMGGVPIDEVPIGKSQNQISVVELTVKWTGQIEGEAVYEATMMLHRWEPPMGGPDTTMNVHEKIHFDEVTVLGKTGSLTLATCFGGSKGVFRWTVIEGTEELADLHGHGMYWLADPINGIYDYKGYVHFDP